MSQRIYIGDWDVSNSMRLSGSFVYSPFPLPFEVELLVVGGGGGGSVAQLYDNGEGSVYVLTSGGGGGAGGMITGSFQTNIRNTYNVTIGSGGAGSNNQPSSGTNSSFIGSGLSVTAYGGGAGANLAGDGSDGGSGGGGSDKTGIGGSATIGSFPSGFSGFGNVGGNGTKCAGPPATSGGRAGGGGGAGGAGSASNITCTTVSGAGLQWVDGTTYAKGGGNNGSSNLGNTGWGGDIITGFSPSSGVKGANGIVKLRYRGLVKATGGTITQDDGYTYHTFTSNDTFEIISSVDT